MPREIRALWMTLVVSALLVGACKQKSQEEPEPAALPSASAAPAETAAATPPPPDTIPPPTQPPPTPAAAPAAAKPESIKACCTALHKEESSATGSQKSLYQGAASTCDAISQLVAKGVTKKAAALTQLRASLKGGKLPAGCD